MTNISDRKALAQALVEEFRTESRYLRFMPWNRIASEMGYSRRWVLQKHGQALELVEKLLREKAGYK